MLVPFFCPLGIRGWGTRNRGTFMPCLAALVVRRAGPERENVGVPLPVAGSLPGHGVQRDTSSWRKVCSRQCRQVESYWSGDWVLVLLTLGQAWSWALETERVPLCRNSRCPRCPCRCWQAWPLVSTAMLGCSPTALVPTNLPGGDLSRNRFLL